MIAHHGGKNLYYSTHKNECGESDSCDFYDDSCENPSKTEEKVNHLILSSEPLKGENIELYEKRTNDCSRTSDAIKDF